MSDWIDDERELADELAAEHDLEAMRARLLEGEGEMAMVVELPVAQRPRRGWLLAVAAMAAGIGALAFAIGWGLRGDEAAAPAEVGAVKRAEPTAAEPVPGRVHKVNIVEGGALVLRFEGAERVRWNGGDLVHVRAMEDGRGWIALRPVPLHAKGPLYADLDVDGRAERWQIEVKPEDKGVALSAEVSFVSEGALDSARIGAVTARSVIGPTVGQLEWPYVGEVLSGFTRTRRWRFPEGIGGGVERHEGIDIVGDEGSVVGAAGAGKVVLAERLRRGGYSVVIDHGDELFTVYHRLGSLRVRVGDQVTTGQRVGSLGYDSVTKSSRPPHVHFGVKLLGHFISPEHVLPKRASPEKRLVRAKSVPPVAGPGLLTLSTRPWTEVYLDGKKLGTTPIFRKKVRPGEHTLTFVNKDLEVREKRTIVIKAGEVLKQSYRFDFRKKVRKTKQGVGTITINAQPWARVTIDDKPVGTTPVFKVKLKPGKHRILLANPRGARRELVKEIKAGEHVEIRVDLEE